MMSRLVRFQLVLFVVVTLAVLVYSLINYIKLPQTLGVGRYDISMQMPEASDLYPQASVTYLGVEVGRVKSVKLTSTGVDVTMQIDDGTHLPKDSSVFVESTSAVGEQYVNFVSASGSGPYFGHGAVVPAGSVTIPPQVTDVLQNVDQLVKSIPLPALRTTVDELYTGLNGNAGALRQLIDSSQLLVHTAYQDVQPTQDLIENATQVLQTQLATAPNLTSYTQNLAAFTQTLVGSDADLRGTLAQTSGIATAAGQLFTSLQPILPTLLSNTTNVGKVLHVYIPSLEDVLTELPASNNYILSDVYSTPTIDGKTAATLNLKAGVDNGYCTNGFALAGNQRDPQDLALTAVPLNSYCGANGAQVSNTNDPRGMRFAPCPSSTKRGPTAASCGYVFDSKPEADGTQASIGTSANATPSSTTSSAQSSSTVLPYDPLTGLLQISPTQSVILGDALTQDVPTSWKSLFYNTMGVG